MEKEDDQDEMKKKMAKEEVPKGETWIGWWKKQWKGANYPRAEVHLNQNKASVAEPARDPDKTLNSPDRTCVDENNRVANTRDEEDLRGPHVLHNTK